MKKLLLSTLAGLALVACTSEVTADVDSGAPDQAPKAATVAFKIDGMT